MSKSNSLISLINSLTKPERKKASSFMQLKKNTSDYAELYKLVLSNPTSDSDDIREKFLLKKPGASFNIAVNYLFENLLLILNQLRIGQDSDFYLYSQLSNAKILFEKSLYDECISLLERVQQQAVVSENYHILLQAQKMELEFRLLLNFQDLSEKELLNKQLNTNQTIKKIRKEMEHASLYELLKYRILHKGPVRSKQQQIELNDLIVSEMSIIASSGVDSFQIQKNHKLFQSNYLIHVGDYKSALNSYRELNELFEQNMHLLSNPPTYYLDTIEGVLESLRRIKNFEEINYFTERLKLLEHRSINFKAQVDATLFLYTLLPLIDSGKFDEAQTLVNSSQESIYKKLHLLTSEKQFLLLLYSAITSFCNNDFKTARQILVRMIQSKQKTFSKPAMRTVRLINTMILYELHEIDLIESEIRSIKRELKSNDIMYQTEKLILKMVRTPGIIIPKSKRNEIESKTDDALKKIRDSKFEAQLLHIFDFTTWIEAKIHNTSIQNIIVKRNTQNESDASR